MATTPEGRLLEQAKWALDLLSRRGLLQYTRIHVMPVIRGERECPCGTSHPVLSRNDDMAGFSDIEVVLPPHGRVIYLELKSLRGKLSESQERFRDSRERVGAPVLRIDSLSDLLSALENQGVPLDDVVKGLAARSHRLARVPLDSARGTGVREVGGGQASLF